MNRAPKLGLSTHNVFSARGCVPSPDFFVTLHDIGTVQGDNLYEGQRHGAIYLRLCELLVKGDGARSVYLHTSECHKISTTATA